MSCSLWGASRAASRVEKDRSALCTAPGAHAPIIAATRFSSPAERVRRRRVQVDAAHHPPVVLDRQRQRAHDPMRGAGASELRPPLLVQQSLVVVAPVHRRPLKGGIHARPAKDVLDRIQKCNVLLRGGQRERQPLPHRGHAQPNEIWHDLLDQFSPLRQLGGERCLHRSGQSGQGAARLGHWFKWHGALTTTRPRPHGNSNQQRSGLQRFVPDRSRPSQGRVARPPGQRHVRPDRSLEVPSRWLGWPCASGYVNAGCPGPWVLRLASGADRRHP